MMGIPADEMNPVKLSYASEMPRGNCRKWKKGREVNLKKRVIATSAQRPAS
jgi:hypothetical protein